MGSEQFGLDTEDVAIAAAEMENRFDRGVLLNELAGHLRAEARAGAWAVRNVYAINAVLLAQDGTGDFFGCIDATRGQNLDEGDELTGGEFSPKRGLFGDGYFGQPFLPGACPGLRRLQWNLCWPAAVGASEPRRESV